MLELNTKNYDKVSNLISEIPFNNYMFKMVIEHKTGGKVFVDNKENPRVCLIIHKYGMSFLCGSNENDFFNEKLAGFLRNDNVNNSMAKWMLTYPEKEWETKITSLLGKKLIKLPEVKEEDLQHYKASGIVVQTERVNFKFKEKNFRNNSKMPDGCEIRQINSDLYKKIKGSVVPNTFYDNEILFQKNAIGFSLLYNDCIVSSCFSSALTSNKLELGVETDEKFRGKGFSEYPVSVLINYCIEYGYEPVWACRKENVASFKLASKMGFSPFSYHPYYTIPM